MNFDNNTLNPILKDFLQSYLQKDSSISNKEWLQEKLKQQAVELTTEALEKYTTELVGGVESYNKTLQSIEESTKAGKSADEWLEENADKEVSAEELENVDEAFKTSNVRLLRSVKADENLRTITPTAEDIVAEQICIDSFNSANSNERYEAAIDTPTEGSVYGRNLFDIVVKDKFTGKKLENYQIKYGDTAEETIDMISSTDSAGQKFVVPEEMLDAVKKALPTKEILSKIGGTKLATIAGNPLTKALVQDCLSGNLPAKVEKALDNPKELIKSIADNAVASGVISSGLLSGIEKFASKETVEDFNGKEILEKALLGDNEGLKIAASGALATCVQKGMMRTLPKNTPAIVISSLASAGIENIKILSQVANKEMSMKDALTHMGNMNLTMAFEFVWGKYSSQLAARALNFIPVVGPILSIAVSAGVLPVLKVPLKIAVIQAAKRVAITTKSIVKTMYSKVKSVAVSIKEKIKNFFS